MAEVNLSRQIGALEELNRRGKLTPQQQAALAELKKRNTPSRTILSTAAEFGRGVNRELLATLGIQKEQPGLFGPAKDWLASTFADKPPGAPEEGIAARVGQEVWASLLPTGVAMKIAPALAPLAQYGKNAVTKIIGQMAQSMAAKPAATFAGDIASATTAGIGAGVAQQAAPGSTGAEVAGQFLGGFVPAATMLGPARMMYAAAKRYGTGPAERLVASVPGDMLERIPVVGGGLKNMAKRGEADIRASAASVAQKQAGELSPVQKRQLAMTQRLMQRMPGFKPTLAQASGSQPLLNLQQDIESRATGGALTGTQMVRVGQEKAIQQAAQTARPQTQQGPSYVFDVAARTIDDMQAPAKAEMSSVEQARRGIAVIPQADRTAAGETLRGAYWNARDKVSSALGKVADEIGLNRADWTANFTQWRNNMVAMFPKRELGNPADYPDVMRRIDEVGEPAGAPAMGDVMAGKEATPDKMVDFQELKSLREWLFRSKMESMSGATPNRPRARTLDGLIAQLDDFIDEAGGSAFGDAYTQFRQRWRDEFINVFEKGPAFKTKEVNGRGFYVTEPEFTADLYFGPGRVSDARQFKLVYGDDPGANAALEAVAMDKLRDTAVREGTLDQGKLNDWTTKHRTVLDEFPNVRQRISDLASAESALLARQADIQTRLDQLGDTKLVSLVQKVQGMNATPQQAIDRAVGDPRIMAQLVQAMRGDQEATGAIKRHVWDSVIDGGDIPGYIDKNRAVLRMLFSDKQLLAIRSVADARALLAQTKFPTGTVEYPRVGAAIEEALGGMTIPQLGTRGYALTTGRVGLSYPLAEITMRILRGHGKDDIERALKRAIYDPDLATDLLEAASFRDLGQKARIKIPAAILRRIYPRLFTAGITMGGGFEQEQETSQEPVQPVPVAR